MDQYAQITIGTESDRGTTRDINEDRMGTIVVPDPTDASRNRTLCVVADGMGGHAAGEVASQLAVDTVTRQFPTYADLPVTEALQEAIKAANNAIFEAAGFDDRAGMGTTVVCAVFSGDQLVVAHVGDSRAYLLRNGELTALTEDHSLVNEQLRSGIITAEEAAQSTNRHILSRALGKRPEVTPEVRPPLALAAGDLILLCSDGVHGYIDHSNIETQLTQTWDQDPGVLASALLDLANNTGGYDNATAIVIRVDRINTTSRPVVARTVTQPTGPREVPVPEPVWLDTTYSSSLEQVDIAEMPREQPAPSRLRNVSLVIAGSFAGIIILCLVGLFGVTSLNRNITAGPTILPAMAIALGSPTSAATAAINRTPTSAPIMRATAAATVTPAPPPTATVLPSSSPLLLQTPTRLPMPSPTTSPMVSRTLTAAPPSDTPTLAATPAVAPTIAPSTMIPIPALPPSPPDQSWHKLTVELIPPLIPDETQPESEAVYTRGLRKIEVTVESEQLALEPEEPLEVQWPITDAINDLQLELVPQGNYRGAEMIKIDVSVVVYQITETYHIVVDRDALTAGRIPTLIITIRLRSTNPIQTGAEIPVAITWNGNKASLIKFTGRVSGLP